MRNVALTFAIFALAACNQDKAATTTQPSATAADTAAAPAAAPAIDLSPVDAAGAKDVMHERHDGMEKVGKAMKQLSRDMKADPVDLASVAPNAAAMAKLANESSAWFRAGTGPDVGKTGAKPDIWQKPDDFKAKLVDFQKASAAFDAAARGGNADATKAAFGDMGKSCKACHDSYRSKEEH